MAELSFYSVELILLSEGQLASKAKTPGGVIIDCIQFPSLKFGTFPTSKIGTFQTSMFGTFQTSKFGIFSTSKFGMLPTSLHVITLQGMVKND